jgi:hypothetical protein
MKQLNLSEEDVDIGVDGGGTDLIPIDIYIDFVVVIGEVMVAGITTQLGITVGGPVISL